MGLKCLINILKSCNIVILLSSTFVVSETAECNDYGMRNIENDNGEDWKLYTFTDRGRCFICHLSTSGRPGAELALPCSDQNQRPIYRMRIVYVSRVSRRQAGQNGKSINYNYTSEECKIENSTETQLDKENIISSQFTPPGQSFVEELIIDIEQLRSYRLKALRTIPGSIICLRRVELNPMGLTTTTSPSTKATKGQTQNNFPPWLIFFIVLTVVLGNITVVVVVACQRKPWQNQQDNHINARSTDVHSNQRKNSKRVDGDAISNPAYGQDTVIGNDDEYHPYVEIDIKEPADSGTIYNSTYESSMSN